jgi:FtsH-binding integral membrane protein
MVDISLYLVSAIVMFVLEFFVLLRIYKRPQKIQTLSLIIAPLMIVLALWITMFIQKQFRITKERVNPLVLFFVLVLLELPLSLYGYELTPNASIPERLIVAGVFGVASVLIAQSIMLCL